MKRSFRVFVLALTLLVGLLAFSVPTLAADGAPAEVAKPASPGAPVVVFNRRITVLRATLFGVSARDRAGRASAWLSTLLERPGAGKITVVSQPIGNGLLVDGALGFVITEADTDKLAQETLEDATNAAKAALERVVAYEREAHDLSFQQR